MIGRFNDPEVVRREGAWYADRVRCAARFAWARMTSETTDDHFLPESRGRAPRSVTWWTWWQQRFGAAAGLPLDRYIEVHGVGTPDAV